MAEPEAPVPSKPGIFYLAAFKTNFKQYIRNAPANGMVFSCVIQSCRPNGAGRLFAETAFREVGLSFLVKGALSINPLMHSCFRDAIAQIPVRSSLFSILFSPRHNGPRSV